MIKNILVPHDGSTHAATAVAFAMWLAKKYNATITGINVVDTVALEGSMLHDISGSMGFEPFMDFSSKMREMLEESGKVILGNFMDRCKEGDVECHDVLGSGIVASAICKQAKLADIVIMGRRGANEEFDYTNMGSVAEAVIRKSSKPVILVPDSFEEPASALVSFDGSVNAGKALHSAAEFATTVKLPLTVLSVSEDESAKDYLKDAEDYLAPYKLDVKYVFKLGEAPADIVAYLGDNQHDLIFMGTSHHSRVVDMVLGSTTECVMRVVQVPFFLAK